VARVALQLWTIRGECERDLEGTLRRIGDLGYEGVELVDLYGHEPERVRGWLDESGLVAVGRHARLEVLEDSSAQLAAELAALGTDRVAVGWIDPTSFDRTDEVVARIASVAQAVGDAGLRFGVHNHADELRPVDGGATLLDLLRELPAELVWLELDLGWIWYAGADPLVELEATSGRCPLVHLKDYRGREGRDDVPVGDGIVGYERLVPAALEAGVEWLIVEEDEVDGDPFAAVERSLRNVRGML
jgi:sugar phosphate isomerase/epimerase